MPPARATRLTAAWRGVTRWRPRGRPPRWPLSIALVAGLGAAVGGLGPAFTQNLWWFGAMGVALFVTVGTVLLRVLIRFAVLPSLGGLVLLLLGLTFAFARDDAILGVIPTADVFGTFAELSTLGIESMNAQTVPADPVPGIVFLLVIGTGLLAILLDLTVVAGRPALAGIPLLGVLLAPTFVVPGAGHPFFFCLTAASYLVALYLDIGEARVGPAIGVGTAASVLALVLPIVLPPVVDPRQPTADAGLTIRVNPLVSLGDNLRQPIDAEVLTYVTENGKGDYLKLLTIDIFAGRWLPNGPITNPNAPVTDIGPIPGLDPSHPTTKNRVAVVIGNLRGNWLPVPYAPRTITGADENWSYNPLTLEITSGGDGVFGEVYEVASERPILTAEGLRATGTDPGDGLGNALPRSLLVPLGLSDEVRDLTATIVEGETTNFDKAKALEAHFRSGEYEYSELAPVEEGYEGTNVDVIAEFLRKKRGYCVHFAGAMAVMARTVGIPSRVAVGFTQGEWVEPTEETPGYFSVTTHDLHAWPELWFDSYGWVRFEPTASRGQPAELSRESDLPEPEEEPTATAAPTNVPSLAPTQTPSATPSAVPLTPRGDANIVVPVIGVSLLFIVALVVVLLPALRRAIRRLRRLWRVRRRGSAGDAWIELVDTAIDIGWDVGTVTPRQLATRLRRTLPEYEQPVLARLLTAIEASAYSPAAGLALASDLRLLRRHLLGLVSWRDQARAMFSPLSVARPWSEPDRQPAPDHPPATKTL